jgi:hypothetical protein
MKPKYTVLIPNLLTTLKKYRPIKKLHICSEKEQIMNHGCQANRPYNKLIIIQHAEHLERQ